MASLLSLHEFSILPVYMLTSRYFYNNTCFMFTQLV